MATVVAPPGEDPRWTQVSPGLDADNTDAGTPVLMVTTLVTDTGRSTRVTTLVTDNRVLRGT